MSEDAQMLMWGGIIVIVVGVLLAPLMVVLGRNFARKGRTIRNWPRTYAQVIASTIAAHDDSEGGTGYRPYVIYEYMLDGKTYRCSNFDLIDLMPSARSTTTKRAAQARANRYPAGQSAEIRYDPARPEVGVLEVNAPTGIVILLYGLGLFFLCLMGGGGAVMLMASRWIP